MGDRTTVTLCVLTCDKERAEAIFEYTSDYDQEVNDLTWCYQFSEVNYGDLPFLEKLQNAGIPYDSSWEGGSEYGAGTEYCRYTPNGTRLEQTLYASDHLIPVAELALYLYDLPGLHKLIQTSLAKLVVLPWDDQEENAKVFRTIQLINPS